MDFVTCPHDICCCLVISINNFRLLQLAVWSVALNDVLKQYNISQAITKWFVKGLDNRSISNFLLRSHFLGLKGRTLFFLINSNVLKWICAVLLVKLIFNVFRSCTIVIKQFWDQCIGLYRFRMITAGFWSVSKMILTLLSVGL